MKIRIYEQLRKLIRKIITECPSELGVTADTTEVKGFYPYNIERGADIFNYWYSSPSGKGTNDPSRPDGAEEYIGFKTKCATSQMQPRKLRILTLKRHKCKLSITRVIIASCSTSTTS